MFLLLCLTSLAVYGSASPVPSSTSWARNEVRDEAAQDTQTPLVWREQIQEKEEHQENGTANLDRKSSRATGLIELLGLHRAHELLQKLHASQLAPRLQLAHLPGRGSPQGRGWQLLAPVL